MLSIVLTVLAGFLTALSPCVLPILPVVLENGSETLRLVAVGLLLVFGFALPFGIDRYLQALFAQYEPAELLSL